MTYTTIEHTMESLATKLADADAQEVTVRGSITRELLMEPFTIDSVTQFTTLNKARDANVFAQIAETLWMLSGRDDLDWLETYIPQCKKWSDDGRTWRAAYGPRLRGWKDCCAWAGGSDNPRLVDQISEVISKLVDDPQSRQAIITLWNPAQDWVIDSKDYPCNNWLHFIIRDGKLYLNVGVRSNDMIYGLTHIDFFGWAMLQTVIASIIGSTTGLPLAVGSMGWNATSMHVYDHHYNKLDKIIAAIPQEDTAIHTYSVDEVMGSMEPLPLGVGTLQGFDEVAGVIMAMEPTNGPVENGTLLHTMYVLLDVYHTFKESGHIDNIILRLEWAKGMARAIQELPPSDLKLAAIRWLSNRIHGFADLIVVSAEEVHVLEAYGVYN